MPCRWSARRPTASACGWLYDEDRWPSGYAGGLATEKPEHGARYLLFTPEQLQPDASTTLLAVYEVQTASDVRRTGQRVDPTSRPAPGTERWVAWEIACRILPRFNHRPYLDMLSPEAVQTFIGVTHIPYLQALGPEFRGVFTDEPAFHPATGYDDPSFCHRQWPRRADAAEGIAYSWTSRLESLYRERYGAVDAPKRKTSSKLLTSACSVVPSDWCTCLPCLLPLKRRAAVVNMHSKVLAGNFAYA